MKRVQKSGVKFLIVFFMLLGFSNTLVAGSCSNKLFSVTIDSKLTIGDVIENLAETCDMTVIVKDDAAKTRMNKKLYYVKLKNSTLKGFLNTILKDHDLHYTLSGNKLKISYLITRTFRIHYISGQRVGKSQANVTIANSSNSLNNIGGNGGTNSNIDGDRSKTGISIENTDEFKFWRTVESEVQRILIGAGDGSTHYARTGEGWTGPDGRVWEYNPLAPIVNPEAGMVTVTGTSRQINRVARYIHTLTKQIKQQVLIDVRILTVSFDDSSTTGVDWGQLYSLQNFTVNSLIQSQKNINAFEFAPLLGIQSYEYGQGGQQSGANLVSATSNVQVTEIVKFLNTQGDVKSISSPRVMTLNNQPALISVGKELFYKLKSSATGSGGTGVGGAGVAQGETVDSVFAGILLDITPEIDANGMITLKINPSISDTIDDIENDPGAGIIARDIPPDLIRRQIASVIKVKDGEHAILGGLIFSRTGTKINKVPLLGDLPLLEYAFKHEEKINKVEELVMIVTPHIIKNSKSVSLKDLGYSKVNEK